MRHKPHDYSASNVVQAFLANLHEPQFGILFYECLSKLFNFLQTLSSELLSHVSSFQKSVKTRSQEPILQQ